MNTGDLNTGDWNTGDRNTGDLNTGDWNTGGLNTGGRNTGDLNTGDLNTGGRNTGDRNTGGLNTGGRNTGDLNTGDRNTGGRNTGDLNTGGRNTGDRNTGGLNTGDLNTGDWNTGDLNTGFFCTQTPSPMFFDNPTNLTYSAAQNLIPDVILPISCVWVNSVDMSKLEKEENQNHKTIGGYLEKINKPIQEVFPSVWRKMTEEKKQRFLDLPNFDADKFMACTGVDVHKNNITIERRLYKDGVDVTDTISETSRKELLG